MTFSVFDLQWQLSVTSPYTTSKLINSTARWLKAFDNLVNTLQHRGLKHITGRTEYCKNLHDGARNKFLIWL